MKQQTSIIKKIRTKKPPNLDHIAMITGSRWVAKPPFYRNIETGEDYFDIAGAVAWPGENLAGFAVIVAAVNMREKEPALMVLAEIEEKSIEDLISACVEIRERYGYQAHEHASCKHCQYTVKLYIPVFSESSYQD